MRRKIALTFERPKARSQLVKEGRRLVKFDLGGPAVIRCSDDKDLAHKHQTMFLGQTQSVQPDTWFKTVAIRTYNGWDQARRRKLSGDERVARLRVAHNLPLDRPPARRESEHPTLHLGPAAASALRKRETVRMGYSR